MASGRLLGMAAAAETSGDRLGAGVALGAARAAEGLGHVSAAAIPVVQSLGNVATSAASLGSSVVKAAMPFVGLAAGAVAAGGLIAGVTTKMAADFEAVTTTLVTGAGEDVNNLGLIRTGLLDMAGAVGDTPKHLAEGLYMIESAGYHGQAGLDVLKASAMGAKVGMADQSTVADALTTVLKDYNLTGEDAAGVTGQMVSAVAAGKMHMEDFAGSLSRVMPLAASLGIPFEQVAAAEATMTARGVDASRATMGLTFGINSLLNPTPKAAAALEDLGIKSKDVQTRLTSGDLTGALSMINDRFTAVAHSSGMTADQIGNLQQVQEKATAAQMKYDQQVAKFGTDSAEAISQHAALSAAQQKLKASTDGLSPPMARAIDDLANMFGGVRGTTMALNLLGPAMDTYKENVTDIGDRAAGAAKLQQSWALVQEDFNTILDQLKGSLTAAGISIGTVFLPYAKEAGEWVKGHIPDQQQLGDILNTVVKPAVSEIADAFKRLVGPLGDADFNLKDQLPHWAEMAKNVADTVVKIIDFVSTHRELVETLGKGIAILILIGPVLSSVAAIFGVVSGAGSLVGAIFGVVSAAAAALAPVLGVSLVVATGGIILVIGALIAIGILLYKNWDTIKEKAGELGAWIGQKFSELGDAVQQHVGAAISFITSHWTEILVTLLGGPMALAALEVVKHWDEIKAAIGGFFSWLGTQAQHAAQIALSIGKAIVDGIKQGIEGAIGGAVSAAEAGVGQVLNAAKGILGISSPSKAFATIGQQTMQGLANGITGSAGLAKDAASSAVTQIETPFKQSLQDNTTLVQQQAQLYKTAGDTIKSGYAPALDSLTQKMHEQQAVQSALRLQLTDIRDAYSDARSVLRDQYEPEIIAASGAVKQQLTKAYEEQLLLLQQQYEPTIKGLRDQIQGQSKDILATKDALTQEKDAQKQQTDLLRSDTMPVLDANKTALIQQRGAYNDLTTQLKVATIPAQQSLTDNLRSSHMPALQQVASQVRDGNTPAYQGLSNTLRSQTIPALTDMTSLANTQVTPGLDTMNASTGTLTSTMQNVSGVTLPGMDTALQTTSGNVTTATGDVNSFTQSWQGAASLPNINKSITITQNTVGGGGGFNYAPVAGTTGGSGPGGQIIAASGMSAQDVAAQVAMAGMEGFATGGLIPGGTGEPQIILAHGGEAVVPAEAFAKPLPLPSMGVGPSSGQGGVNIYNDFRGTQVISDRDIDLLATKVGNAQVRQFATAGVRIRR